MRFATVCTDIGYIERVLAVYQAKLARQKTENFPYYEDGNMDEKTFVNRQIALLQAGIVNFEFLNYLEANPGMTIRELLHIFKQVYPEAEKEKEALEEVIALERIEDAQNAVVSEVEKVGTSGQVVPEVPGAGRQVGGIEGEVQDGGDDLMEEDPGNARGT